MNARLLQILQHTIGADQFGRMPHGAHRNHFCTSPTSEDGKACAELELLGFMIDHGPQTLAGGMHCWCATPEGIDYVALNSPTPPKLSPSKQRYQRYLKAADCFGSFRDFLRYEAQREKEVLR